MMFFSVSKGWSLKHRWGVAELPTLASASPVQSRAKLYFRGLALLNSAGYHMEFPGTPFPIQFLANGLEGSRESPCAWAPAPM